MPSCGYAFHPEYQRLSKCNATTKDASIEKLRLTYENFLMEHGKDLNEKQIRRAKQAYLNDTKRSDLEMSLSYILKTPDLEF